jgi:serine/threonine protein kinase/tetratricopeptide (TPR) repeat protein
MDLSDLSASELGRIDSICLDFEAELRGGASPSIQQWVASKGGEHAELLRQELLAIRDELSDSSQPGVTRVVSDEDTVRHPQRGVSELPAAGSVLGHYVIVEMIGRGGMGVVFRAMDERLNRPVAIKMLTADTASRKGLTERFKREAKALAALSHPNIVELFDVGDRGGLPYAVMEYLDGELLDHRFQRGGLETSEVRRLGAQVADALAAAHAGGVIHRDLKPHNIMLVSRQGGDPTASHSGKGEAGRELESTMVKLFDFGLSRVPRSDLDPVDETSEGMVLGTPGYMAPEQARGEPVTPAADIFSLGCVLFEAFYRRRAFDGETSAARFRSTIDSAAQPDPIRRRDDVDLADLIDHCLQKGASDRPATVSEVAAMLRGRGQNTRLHADGLRRGEPDRLKWGRLYSDRLKRRHWLALAGGVSAAAIAVSLFTGRGRGIENIHSLAVLSFQDLSADETVSIADRGAVGEPIGDRDLQSGEKLAALLVHELTRLSDLTIPRYRPMQAETAQQFRSLGAQLQVDALLTGTLKTVERGNQSYMVVDVRLISSETGEPILSKRIETDAAQNFLQQSRLATEIASSIGRRLTATADESAPPDVESFSCLVDGMTRSDPESVVGLEKALMCFERAHEVDHHFADALAGIALTSITLAAQSSTQKALQLIVRSREACREALALDPASVDARLALAMLDWQTTNRYLQAERELRELSMVAPNNWQVLHQYGLLQLAMGKFAEAAKSLREASQLNPWSVLAKIDRARAAWFSGNTSRAIEEANRIRDKHDHNLLARGLLVDIYESQKRFDEAAAQHDAMNWQSGQGESDYLQQRLGQLEQLPYGPFGSAMNQAILRSRTTDGIDELQFAELADSTPPMLPLLVAVHPSFGAVRLLDRAQEILPQQNRV